MILGLDAIDQFGHLSVIDQISYHCIFIALCLVMILPSLFRYKSLDNNM